MSEFKGTKGKWHIPHLAVDEATCNCGFVLSEGYCGAIATVHFSVDRELENGDNPPLEEAKANAKLIAYAPEILKMLISLEPHLRLNTQEEIDKWKNAKTLIKEATE